MRAHLAKLIAAPALMAALVSGCSKAPEPPPDSSEAHMHHHHAPHAGTVVVLGDEEYHIELVLDDATGTLQAYVLDSELESFVRSTSASISITATVAGASREIVLGAVANPETGESVGDTSLFEGHADWLKGRPRFDAEVKTVAIRGALFSGVKFSFPAGNEGAH
ncbi:MAG TPA: hypothetical protein VIJ19_08470 [Opitutaceae bacterium]